MKLYTQTYEARGHFILLYVWVLVAGAWKRAWDVTVVVTHIELLEMQKKETPPLSAFHQLQQHLMNASKPVPRDDLAVYRKSLFCLHTHKGP